MNLAGDPQRLRTQSIASAPLAGSVRILMLSIVNPGVERNGAATVTRGLLKLLALPPLEAQVDCVPVRAEPPRCHRLAQARSLLLGSFSSLPAKAAFLYSQEFRDKVAARVGGVPDLIEDVAMAHKLLHGDENIAFGDSAYTGVNQREEIKALNADIDWQIAVRRSSIEKLPESEKEAARQREHEKASRRAIVEHPFHIIKNIFGFRKTWYRGISKNHNLLYMLFASSNLLMCTRRGLTLQDLYPSRA